MGYQKSNTDTIQQIKDSLGIDVLFQSEYDDKIDEHWQVEGHQIDSIIKRYDQDTIFNFIEKSFWIQYESIRDDNPLNYYPLHVGDYWVYDWSIDGGVQKYVTTSAITHTELKPNGLEYFHRFEENRSTYERIDPSTGIVYQYDETADSTNYEILRCSLTAREGDTLLTKDGLHQIYSDEYEGELFKINTNFYNFYIPAISTYIENFAYGFGSCKRIHGLTGETTKILKGCIIDGIVYGDTSLCTSDPNDSLDFFPLQIGNRWQYTEDGVEIRESKAVRDSTMPNSKTYTIIEGVFFRGYYRKDGNKVYSYNTSTNEEKLEYDFSLQAGDTLRVEVEDRDTLITFVSSIGYTEKFCEDRKYFNYSYEWVNASEDVEDRFIDGLGFSRRYWLLSYGLTGAVIDGVTYGKIVNVENPNEFLPKKFNLSQNYPNPFNPSTKISYSLPKQGLVELKVYDVLGREVATLVNKEQQAGNYEVQFDAGNLTSGIYFYKLKAGEFVESRKMMLVK